MRPYQKQGSHSSALRFSLVECTLSQAHLRFFVTQAPNDKNIDSYLKDLQHHNISNVVRVCQATYSKSFLEEHNVKVHDLYFADGKAPPSPIMQEWRKIVHSVFYNQPEDAKPAIAVHCVAGLGRAPVMVAIALIDEGMQNSEAIKLIRTQIPGSFNQQQIHYLMNLSPQRKTCIIC